MVGGGLLYAMVYWLPLLTLLSGVISLFLWRKNLVLTIISLELRLVASHIGFILTSVLIDDAVGFIFSIIGLTLAGAEVSLGLALSIIAYRKFDTVYSHRLEFLKS